MLQTKAEEWKGMNALNGNPPTSSSMLASKKKKLPPFVSKLYAMVEDPATNHIISWGNLPSQDSFVVHRVEELTTDILPLYFKHCNFCSFIRQVNTYGFTKTNPDAWEFQNAFFMRGHPELLEKIERRTSVKRSPEKEENGQADHSRLLKLSKTAEQVDMLTRENKILNDELSKVKQESTWNEQLVKQFLLELKAAKQRQREMQEREAKLLNVLREMAGGAVPAHLSRQLGLPTTTTSTSQMEQVPPRIVMPPAPSAHEHMHHSRSDEIDLSAQMPDSESDFDLVEAYMLKLGLSTHDGSSSANHQQHSYNPPSPFQAPLAAHTFPTPPASPHTAAPQSYPLLPTPPQSPFHSWTAAPASPSAFFFGTEGDQSFKFGESYLSNAVGDWPGYSTPPRANIKQEPGESTCDQYSKETCEDFLERYLDQTAATFSSTTATSPISTPDHSSSLSTPSMSSPFPAHSPLWSQQDPSDDLHRWEHRAAVGK